jgi:hypothetical protein
MSCPAQSFILIHMTMSGPLSKSYSSWLHLFLYKPFSCTAPKMHLSIFLSNTLNNLSSVFDSVQVSDAYVSTGLTSTSYVNVLVFPGIKCDFTCFLRPWKQLFADKIRFWMLQKHVFVLLFFVAFSVTQTI